MVLWPSLQWRYACWGWAGGAMSIAAGLLNFILVGSASPSRAGVRLALLDGWRGWRLAGAVLAYAAIQTLESCD